MTGNEYRIWKVAMMRLMGAAARTVAARHSVDGEQYYILMWTMVSFSRKNGNLLTEVRRAPGYAEWPWIRVTGTLPEGQDK